MLRKLLTCRRGVISVEAALVFPVLILLAVGATEFGMLISATREATRQVAVNFTDADGFAEEVAARLPRSSRPAADVAVTRSASADSAAIVIRVVVIMPGRDPAEDLHLPAEA